MTSGEMYGTHNSFGNFDKTLLLIGTKFDISTTLELTVIVKNNFMDLNLKFNNFFIVYG